MSFNRITMALYATFLTNWYGFKLKNTVSSTEKKRLRIEYAQKLLGSLNINVTVKGAQNLPQSGQFLLLCNHRSIIDPLIVEIALKETAIFGLWVSKKELYNSFFFGTFTRNAGSILLDREAKQMSGFFKDIKSAVQNGDSIFIFPEGTRNKEQTELSEFKDGARIIAVKNRLRILPVYIRDNADAVLDSALKNSSGTFDITVEIGEPIDAKDRSLSLEEAYRKSFRLSR